ncbi:transporter substrate-binding domain-containing protein [Cupriavidus sp. 2TAF22]|uniref:transporter substrate-binding domain-containing protein n=1 Tax=unclassified Cupriavidus TaxID=2640874 RepID=UPI003F93559C
MTIDASVLRDLAPHGRVRAAINFGNAALAQRDPATGAPGGISVAMAYALGEQLGLETELVPYDAAGKVTDALADDAWDVAFLAVDPVRADRLAFSPAYVQIAACYMVHAASPLQRPQDVDAPGRSVAVGKGAAYDLHLTRTLKQARIERRPTAAEAFALFESAPLDAAAGVRRVIEQYAATRPHLRVMADDFLAIDQALCLPRGREAGAAWLHDFVEAMKRNGFVADALKRAGKTDIAVAPPAA